MEIDDVVVNEAIRLAREYRESMDARARPGFVSLGDFDLEEEENDPARIGLTKYLDGLSADNLALLVALMWIGRGDYPATDLDDAVRIAHNNVLSRGSAVAYLTEKKDLASELLSGLRGVTNRR